MGERHLDPLFSTAYDGELDPVARRRFDTHLDGCAACATAWDEYRTALDAVRALPVLTMPATVRLPVGAPQVEAGRSALLARWWTALLHPQPVAAAAGLAAVALALVVLAVHHGGGASSTAGSGVALSGGSQAQNDAPAAGGPDLRFGALAPGSVTPCLVTQVPPSSSGASSAGFSHTASSTVGGRELVLATSTDHYAPGAEVPIYARLTGGSSAPGGTDVVPCVTLQTEAGGSGSGSSGALAAPAPGAAAGTVPQAPATPIAVATSQPAPGAPAAARGADSQFATAPYLSVRIPAGIPPGTVLRLVALIPAESSPTGLPVEVVLEITVR